MFSLSLGTLPPPTLPTPFLKICFFGVFPKAFRWAARSPPGHLGQPIHLRDLFSHCVLATPKFIFPPLTRVPLSRFFRPVRQQRPNSFPSHSLSSWSRPLSALSVTVPSLLLARVKSWALVQHFRLHALCHFFIRF